MSTTLSTQTRNPRAALTRALLDTENYHYLPIQKDNKDYKSPLSEYLYMESPTRPGEPMYMIVADGEKGFNDRALAGASDNVLLRCTKEDYEFCLKETHDRTIAASAKKTKTVLKDTEGQEYESVETLKGGILTG